MSMNEDLMFAAENESYVEVRDLIKKGAEVNYVDKYGSALSGAVYYRNEKVINVLIMNGVNLDLKHENDNTVLMKAADQGNIEMVSYLIYNGAGVNLVNKQGKTALTFAVKNGNVEIIKILLSEGADINIGDNYGNIIYYNKHKQEFILNLINLAEIADLLVKDGSTNISSFLANIGHIFLEDNANILVYRYKALLNRNGIKFNYEEEIDKITNNKYIIDQKLRKELINSINYMEYFILYKDNINKAVDLLIKNIEADVSKLLPNKPKYYDTFRSILKETLVKEGIKEYNYHIFLNRLKNNHSIPDEIKDELVDWICGKIERFDSILNRIFTKIYDVKIYSDSLMHKFVQESKESHSNAELSFEDKEKIINFYVKQQLKFKDQLIKYFNNESMTDLELRALGEEIESANIGILIDNFQELLRNGHIDLDTDFNSKYDYLFDNDLRAPVYKVEALLKSFNQELVNKSRSYHSCKTSLTKTQSIVERWNQDIKSNKTFDELDETFGKQNYLDSITFLDSSIDMLDSFKNYDIKKIDEVKSYIIFGRAMAHEKIKDYENASNDFHQVSNTETRFSSIAKNRFKKCLESMQSQVENPISDSMSSDDSDVVTSGDAQYPADDLI